MVARKCNSALAHPSLGILALPTVVVYSRTLSKLAIGLDKRPDLIVRPVRQSGEDGDSRETLPERAANIVRQAFVTCLNDRSGQSLNQRDTQPEGKKIGIYRLANLCLKILFQCRKTRNAEQIFVNIYNQSPPLSSYPKSQRVTYLYYLGRFLFSNNHFYRAQLALQAAYEQCHRSSTRHRRLILIHLIVSNLVLGRFPSSTLLSRPEAGGLEDIFVPVCRAIAKGDTSTLHQLLGDGTSRAAWLKSNRVLLQMRNRCEVLAWRSLARKVFLLRGFEGDPNARKAPTFGLIDLLYAFQVVESKERTDAPTLSGPRGQRHTNWIFMHGSNQEAYVDRDLEGAKDVMAGSMNTDMLEIECIVSSLIDQGLLNGFISHRQLRFAIIGAKKKGALAAGFPNIWEAVVARCDEEVPGWKKATRPGGRAGIHGGMYGPGMVVNLSGARPAGVR